LNLRWFAYGYRSHEVNLALPAETVPITIDVTKVSDQSKRPPMMASMGPILLGATLPHPDQSDTKTMVDGVKKRIAAKLPQPCPKLLKKFKKFVKRWLQKNMVPLSPDTDLSFESWIESRPYPEWRKKELREIYEKIPYNTLKSWYKVVKAFMKDENYPEFKHARGIYARSDYFKVLFGPFVSKIEEQIYAHPAFIKHVPVKDRPAYIQDMLKTLGDEASATDYTSFEATFSKILMKCTDQVMFKFFNSQLSSAFHEEVFSSLMDINKVIFKWFKLEIEAKRMSGEMNTSVSNGFCNLMAMLFLCEHLNLGSVRMVVEGDDGLAKTSSGRFPTPADFAMLGMNIKLERHNKVERASFCGMVFDSEELINITDPRKVLANFGWASQRYASCGSKKMKTLLRCKALSLAYQYPGCPIIQELAQYGLRITSGCDLSGILQKDRKMSFWERERLRQAIDYQKMVGRIPAIQVGPKTRMLVEELYNITVEVQLQIEEVFRKKTDLSPFELNLLDFPSPWYTYFARYVLEAPIKDPANYIYGMGSYNWAGQTKFKQD